jgi:SAM-dependent methyltransferase
MLSAEESMATGRGCPCCGGEEAFHWIQVPDRVEPGRDIYDLLRCPRCLHTWLGNRPAPEDMGYYYGPNYHRAVSHAGETSPRRWERQLAKIAQYKTGGAVLDIGCSSGGFLGHLKSGPWKLYGIEADVPTAERARTLTGAEVFAGDVLAADFPANSFDVVTCSDVLEHLYEPAEVLRRVHRWLKPGGIFYVLVPNILSWESRAFGTYWYGLDLPRHLHHFSAKSLAGLANSVGLRKRWLVTPAGSYVEHSTLMLVDGLARKVNPKRKPLDLSPQRGIAWRALRKGFRITLEAMYAKLAASCGASPSIQAVFQKDAGSAAAQAD